MKARKPLSLLLAAALLAAVFCGCGNSTTTSTGSAADTGTADSTDGASEQTETVLTGEPTYGGEIVVGIAQDLDDSLDPHSMTAAGTREVLFNVFEGLVKPDTDGNLIPAVASSYVIAETGDTFTFTLREGVKFHDGSTVTVGDIVYSISRAAGLDTGEPLISALSVIDSVTAADDSTVVITTSEPYIELLAYLTAAIIPEGSDPAEDMIGTGPFVFVSRVAQDSIVLEKFDDYWGEGAYLDKVTYKIMEDSTSLIMSLQSGAIDLCAHLTASQAAELNGFTIYEGTMNLVQALYLNNASGPLADVRVRQAICYAIDSQEIMDFVSDGMGVAIGTAMIAAFGKYTVDGLENTYAADTEKAKELLTEAGYPDGFELEITVPSNYQFHIDTAEVMVEQLSRVGINATIKLVEWATWLSDVYADRNYEATVVGFDASAMTASALLARYVSTSSKNAFNFSSEAYDAAYAAAEAATDEAEQTELYKECETILAEEAASAYVQDPCDLVAMNSELAGYEFYPLYAMDMSKVYYVG